MAEQATDTVGADGTVASTGAAGTVAHDASSHLEHNPGRPISWVGTSATVIGFIVGGVSFVPNPNWVVFWVGAGIAIIGLLILLFSKTMSEDWY